MSEERPFAFLSRRRFLRWSLIGGGSLISLSSGVVNALLALRGKAPEVAGLRVLTAHEYRTLQSIADAQLPRGGAFALGALDMDLGRRFDAFLAQEPQQNIDDLKAALFLVEMGPPIFERRPITFSNLNADERLAHWQGWIAAPQLIRRQASLAFRKFLSIVFYDEPQVWPGIGYPGPGAAGRRAS
ncbi:MAG: hypothetical protein H6707_12470 [Deltaproteobacteria bacterium]|nr:hypothetical protein [Deltaproteobacteria bacterium]